MSQSPAKLRVAKPHVSATLSQAREAPEPDGEALERAREAFGAGACTVAMATAEFGLSRDELFLLMDAGTLVWMPVGAKRVRYIARSSLVDHMARLYLASPHDGPE